MREHPIDTTRSLAAEVINGLLLIVLMVVSLAILYEGGQSITRVRTLASSGRR